MVTLSTCTIILGLLLHDCREHCSMCLMWVHRAYWQHLWQQDIQEGSLLMHLRSTHSSEVEQFHLVAVHMKKLMQFLCWTHQHAYVYYTMTHSTLLGHAGSRWHARPWGRGVQFQEWQAPHPGGLGWGPPPGGFQPSALLPSNQWPRTL